MAAIRMRAEKHRRRRRRVDWVLAAGGSPVKKEFDFPQVYPGINRRTGMDCTKYTKRQLFNIC